MIDIMLIAVTSGLLAGLASCTLPVYPILLNILSRSGRGRKASTLLFVSGMALAYILFYSLLALLVMAYGWGIAESIDEKRGILFLFAALLSFFFALDTLFHINVFKRTLVFFNKVDYTRRRGVFLSGLSYGSIITPCSAPFLITGILPVLASKATYPQGLVLVILFSVSLSLPLLVLGLSSAVFLDELKWLQRNVRKIEFLSVLFLTAVGVYFLRLYLAGVGA